MRAKTSIRFQLAMSISITHDNNIDNISIDIDKNTVPALRKDETLNLFGFFWRRISAVKPNVGDEIFQ